MSAICHWTQRPFEPVVTKPSKNPAFVWVECEVCDADGHIVGEDGYDRSNPGQHVIKTETASAGTLTESEALVNL